MNVIALDPSSRGTGIALFLKSRVRFVDCFDMGMVTRTLAYGAISKRAVEQFESSLFALYDVDHVVCEVPQIYKQSKGDPNDLIAVAMVAGALCAAIRTKKVHTCLPKTWKGQVPKQAHHPRIMRALDDDETSCVRNAAHTHGAKSHNIVDAVGLGIWFLKKNGLRA